MALQVWLPLNGDLTQQGLSNCTVTAITSPVYTNEGKIGKGMSSGALKVNYKNTTTQELSVAFWIKSTGTALWRDIFSFGSALNRIEMANETNRTQDWYHTGGSSLISNQSLFNLPSNDWQHITMTANGQNVCFYINGVLNKTCAQVNPVQSSMFDRDYFYIGTRNGSAGDTYPGCLNDFRVYDHALSAKEVKDLAKGLVLHYRLAGPGQENLAKNSGKYTVSNKFTMTTASTDGITCPGIYYNNFNTTKQYTLTVECDGTLNTGHLASRTPADRYWTIWIYYHDTPFTDTDYNRYQDPICYSSSSAGFKKISDTKYSWTFTPSKANGSIRLNTYSDGTNAITVKFWNIKVEEGSVATPWCPNSADALYSALGYNNNIEYDCSGYRRNGIKSGSITWDIDSPRYATSYKFVANTSKIKLPAFNMSGFANSYTFSWWQYNVGSGNMPWGFSDGNRLNPYHIGNLCWNTGDGDSNPFVPNIASSTLYNAWHHIAITGNGTDTKLYIDGEYKGKATTYKGLTGTQIYLSGWNTGTSYTMAGSREADFRIYATALSAEDIAELYHSAVIVDNTGKSYAYEYFEA